LNSELIDILGGELMLQFRGLLFETFPLALGSFKLNQNSKQSKFENNYE
jgi:hypothetical protein